MAEVVEKCRVCLEELENGEECVDLHDDLMNTDSISGGSHSLKVYEQIEYCCGVRVRPSPELPKKVCARCVQSTWNWFNFRDVCLKSQMHFEAACADENELATQLERSENDNAYFERLYNKLQINNRQSMFNETRTNVDNEQGELMDMIDMSEYSAMDSVGSYKCDEQDSDSATLTTITRTYTIDDDAAYLEDDAQSIEQKYTPVDYNGEPLPSRDAVIKPITSEIANDMALVKDMQIAEDDDIMQLVEEAPEGYIRPIRKRSTGGSGPGKRQGSATFMCNICANIYSKRSRFKAHMDAHNGVKNYSCDICNKRFRQLNELNAHVRRHTGEKPYHCSYCDRCFASTGERNRHVRIHTGEKPYKCQQCHREFSSPAVLKNHIKMHTGEKDYKCNVCDKAFTLLHQLKSHLTTKTHQSRLITINQDVE